MCPEVVMRLRLLLVVAIVCGLIAVWTSRVAPMHAQPARPSCPDRAGDLGRRRADGRRARQREESGSTITITVVSDRERTVSLSGIATGTRRVRAPHPRGRLRPRARGDGDRDDLAKTATVDLKLQKTRDLASQLTNADWFASFPGTEAQKSVDPRLHALSHARADRPRRTTTRTGWSPSSSGCRRIRSCRSR